MSFKKYIKYTSLGLALSISSTTLAPSMSSAQENSNTISTSNYKSANYHSNHSKVSDATKFYSHEKKNGKYYLKTAGVKFETSKREVAERFRENLETVRSYQEEYGDKVIADTYKFINVVISTAEQHPFDLRALADDIYNYIEDLPSNTREFHTSLWELHKIYAQEVLGWK